MSSNKLFVETLVQKVIFTQEMAGQISDGMWENSGPRDHYKNWMLDFKDVIVSNDRTAIGRNFWAAKDNYNLNSKELLDIVGDRLLFKCQFAYEFPEQANLLMAYNEIPDSAEEFMTYYRMAENKSYASESKHIVEKADLYFATQISPELLAKTTKDSKFQMPQLRIQIAALRRAMKTNLDRKVETVESPMPENPLTKLLPDSSIAALAEAIKEAVAPKAADVEPIVLKNFNGGEIIWKGKGWYQYNRRNAMWSKLETIDHSNSSPIAFIEDADLIDVDEE